MALDPRIALAGVQPAFGLEGVFQGLQVGQGLRANQIALAEQERQLAEEAAVRQQFAQHFGARPQGLAGLGAQMAPSNPAAPVQEQQRAGAPTAMAPFAQPPPGGQAASPGLAGLGAPFGPGAAPAGGQERAFVNQLYAVSPTGAMAYEKHLADQQRAAGEAQEAQMRAQVARVEFLGRVADGVLEAGEPQRAWDAGRAMLIAQGMPESQVPTVYDPSYVQQLSGMARDAKDRYNEGMLRLGLAKEQRERTRQAQAIPDYGLGDKLNAAVYATHGDVIAPGQAPTPAQIHSGRERLIAEERAAEEAKQAGRVGDREKDLRTEFNALTKEYRTVSDAYGRIQSAQETGPGDISLIFSYMKLLDPASTVREGEFATAQNAGGVPERLIAQYNRLISGERLAPETRKQFVDQAQGLYDQSTRDYQRTRKHYEDLATRSGADPANVTADFGSTAAPKAPGTGKGAPVTGKGAPVTADEIGRLAQRSGLAVEEVIRKLQSQGYRIEGLD